MSSILRLPGNACAYWVKGYCAYDEIMNPGLKQEHVCTALLQWTGYFDAFMDQTEFFEQRDVEPFWHWRMAKALERGWDCPDFKRTGEYEEGVGCEFFLDGPCLLRLPRCEGRCRKFVLNRNTARSTTE